MAEDYESQQNSLQTLIDIQVELNNQRDAERLIGQRIAAQHDKQMESLKKDLGNLVKRGKMSKEEYDLNVKQAKISKELTTTLKIQIELEKSAVNMAKEKFKQLQQQKKTLEEITREEERQLALDRQKEQTDKQAEKAAKAAAVAKHAEGIASGGSGAAMGAASAGASVIGGALGGPIGAFIGEFIVMLVGVSAGLKSIGEIAASKIGQASAATGKFVQNINGNMFDDITKQFIGIKTGSEEFFNKTGMSLKEIQSGVVAITAAGIDASKAVDINTLRKFDAAAKATGQDIGAMAGTMVKLRRNMRDVGDEANSAIKIAQAAGVVARQDIMSTAEFSQTIDGLASQFSDLNLDMGKTIRITKDMLVNMKQFGMSGELSKRVLGELNGAFKSTSDEWKAFLGSRQGSGGYVSSLFKTQQRGAGGNLLGRQFDQKEYLSSVVTQLKEMTAGMPDQETQLYMMEQLAKNFGLSSEATQSLLKGVMDGTAGSEDQMADMVKAQGKAQAMQKDYGERLAIILEGTVTMYLKGILDILVSIAKGFIKTQTWLVAPEISNMMGTWSEIGTQIAGGAKLIAEGAKVTAKILKEGGIDYKPNNAGFAIGTNGMPIEETGRYLLHQGEEVLNPNQVKAKNSASSGVSVSANINIMGDARQAAMSAGKQIEQIVYRAIKSNNNAAFGTA